jgi:hypothetical protein
MWERFSYYGMLASLTLYLFYEVTGNNPGLGLPKSTATSLVGAYGGLVYVSTIAGAWMAEERPVGAGVGDGAAHPGNSAPEHPPVPALRSSGGSSSPVAGTDATSKGVAGYLPGDRQSGRLRKRCRGAASHRALPV